MTRYAITIASGIDECEIHTDHDRVQRWIFESRDTTEDALQVLRDNPDACYTSIREIPNPKRRELI